jgi:hypothetical protein
MTVAEKEWWGPRIWTILHTLAEYSDRADALPQWKPVLQLTADVLPCALCRQHFHGHRGRLNYIRRIPDADVRVTVRRFLWDVHRGLRTGAGKETLAEDQLTEVYGGESRENALQRVREGVQEIVNTFTREHVLDRFQMAALKPWERAIQHLMHTLLLPPIPLRTNKRR